MAGLLKSFVGGVFNAAAATMSPNKVQVVNIEDYVGQGVKIIAQEENIGLYKKPGCYDCMMRNAVTGKCCSLFRNMNETEAQTLFKSLAPKVALLLSSSSAASTDEMLQKMCDCIREHSGWTAAHVAAFVGIFEAFRNPAVRSVMDTQCGLTGVTPLMCAIKGQQLACVEELLKSECKLGLVDKYGDSPYHHAVVYFPKCIPTLARFDKEGVINWLNGKGETALLQACKSKNPKTVDLLVSNGADANVTACDILPIHAAVDNDDLESTELIIKKCPGQENARDHKNGGTPIHWAKSKEAVLLLASLGSTLDTVSTTGNTPVHIMMQTGRFDCLMALFYHGADVNITDSEGETPLHWAVQKDDISLVRTIVVFGADINISNKKKQSARHLAATSKGKNAEVILYLLHVTGAVRCTAEVKGCMVGCSVEGNFNGIPDNTMKTMIRVDSVALFDDMLSAKISSDATMDHKLGAVLDMIDTPTAVGDKVLCLDGGGIRGLVLIQMLMEIERAAKRPIRECFDWIGGTSTGGILALGIARGMSLQYIKGLYFRLKDTVFTGRRPYPSEPFEKLLKQEFGEDASMADITGPKVLVTGVLADRHPAQLHIFRNYYKTLNKPSSGAIPEGRGDLGNEPMPQDVKIWEAARRSGAAPTYFRACGSYLDGGLMSNNPTLDVLTEIHEYNSGLRIRNEGHQVRPLGCVVSLGTGRIPVVEVSSVDVFIPTGVFDAAKTVRGMQALLNLMVDQATCAEGRPVDRARAWCSMINVPYFRFSPQLSKDVPLDETDNTNLISMMWETSCYMAGNKHRVQELGTLLRAGPSAKFE